MITDTFEVPLARILESGITLVHPYSRNKSDKEDCYVYCSFLILIHDMQGNNCEIDISSPIKLLLPTIFSVFTCRNSSQNKNRIKSGLQRGTYSWTEFIPLLRKHATYSVRGIGMCMLLFLQVVYFPERGTPSCSNNNKKCN